MNWEEKEENCWKKGRKENIGLDASRFVLSALARAAPLGFCR